MFDFIKTRISSLFDDILKRKKLTPELLKQTQNDLKNVLLEADVPEPAINQLFIGIDEKLVGKKADKATPSELYIKLIYENLVELLGGKAICELSFNIPSIIMVMGVQGSGKTTTVGKLAYYIQKMAEKRGKKRKILLASVDYYRPAALEQLKVLAHQVGVDYYQSASQEPLQSVEDILHKFKQGGYEHLILDTAGRLVADESMMSELEKITKIVKPNYRYLVLDSMTGQQALELAKNFHEKIGFDGAILTKADSESRLGSAVAFRYLLKKPIVMLGVGEKIDALQQFYPERIAQRIIGLGDLQSLLEKADEVINPKDQLATVEAMMSGKYTLDDFAKQLDMVKNMGSLQSIMSYLPGMGGMKITPDMIEKGETESKKFRVIIQSMTPGERKSPKIIDQSRKKRIAKGCGLTVDDIDILLKRFEETSQFAKLLKKSNFSHLLKR